MEYRRIGVVGQEVSCDLWNDKKLRSGQRGCRFESSVPDFLLIWSKMAIFEYKCSECGRVSEFLATSGRKPEIICTHCGGKKMKKQFSVFTAGVKQGDSKRCDGCSDDTCPHARL